MTLKIRFYLIIFKKNYAKHLKSDYISIQSDKYSLTFIRPYFLIFYKRSKEKQLSIFILIK